MGFKDLMLKISTSDHEYVPKVPIVKKPKGPERKYGTGEVAANYAMEVIFFFHDLNKVRDYLKRQAQVVEKDNGKLQV
ncbi:hypothetical protein ACEPPN_008491 [Leptodophora sp. 'Broadleaf-Isolate-01']